MSPGGSIPPFGTATSKPEIHKVMAIRSKSFASEWVTGVIVSDATYISTL